jgi:hypothetical protein
MWLMTPVGFFSVVCKPTDVEFETLTVRARVRSDLEALRAKYLPELGAIQESRVNDYRFRAVAPKDAVAHAVARLVQELGYANFKDEVRRQQGAPRAKLYHEVWANLHRLQGMKGIEREAGKKSGKESGLGEGAPGDSRRKLARARPTRAGGPS